MKQYKFVTICTKLVSSRYESEVMTFTKITSRDRKIEPIVVSAETHSEAYREAFRIFLNKRDFREKGMESINFIEKSIVLQDDEEGGTLTLRLVPEIFHRKRDIVTEHTMIFKDPNMKPLEVYIKDAIQRWKDDPEFFIVRIVGNKVFLRNKKEGFTNIITYNFF